MNILAVDLGKVKSVACDYQSETGKHEFETVRTEPAILEALFTLTLHKSSRFVRFGALKLGVPTIGSPRRQTSRHVRLANTGVWTANDCDFPGDSAISGIPGLRLMQREGLDGGVPIGW